MAIYLFRGAGDKPPFGDMSAIIRLVKWRDLIMGALTKVGSKTVDPKTVAAITAALAVGGYLNPGDRVVGIKKYNGQMDPWRHSGMVEIMTGMNYSLK
jgi:hypothetical protein